MGTTPVLNLKCCKGCRIDPGNFSHKGLTWARGSQILGTPHNSSINNIHLQGGAFWSNNWAALRGGVLKFHQDRREIPIQIDGKQFEIPSAHSLMDKLCLDDTIVNRNPGENVPFIEIKDISSEPLFLVHSGFCHPQDLFLPKGRYTMTDFSLKDLTGIEHLFARGRTLWLIESELDKSFGQRPMNILDKMCCMPESIIVGLVGGGHVTLRE